MKELVITNLRLVADALKNDPINEAHQIIAAINDAVGQWDSQPLIMFDGEQVQAEYRENGEESENA